MRLILAAGVSCLLLAACDSGATAPGAAAPDVEALEDGESPLLAVDKESRSCKDIAALAAAFNEPEPFASLRTGKVKLGDRELDDSFTTAVAPAGGSCSMGVMDGFGTPPAKMHVVNCQLFASGMNDREANAAKAKAVFEAANRDLYTCLPGDWTARDGSQVAIDSTEAMIYETRTDAQRAMTASYYTYPVELRKEWSEGGIRGQTAGWRVTLNFQKDVPATAASTAAQ